MKLICNLCDHDIPVIIYPMFSNLLTYYFSYILFFLSRFISSGSFLILHFTWQNITELYQFLRLKLTKFPIEMPLDYIFFNRLKFTIVEFTSLSSKGFVGFISRRIVVNKTNDLNAAFCQWVVTRPSWRRGRVVLPAVLTSPEISGNFIYLSAYIPF